MVFNNPLRSILESSTQFKNIDALAKIEMRYKDSGVRAIAQVLKNPEPYLLGQKKLSQKKINEIRSLAAKLGLKIREHQLAIQKDHSSKVATLEKLNALMSRTSDNSSKLKEDFNHVLAVHAAYNEWEEGEQIPCPIQEWGEKYQVEKVIKNKKGLNIVIFTPIGPGNGPPIFCCRGTVPTNSQNILDDFGKEIGQRSFKRSEFYIEHQLEELASKFGPAIICGHSLGGAIAQIITSRFCDKESHGKPWIGSCIHYNAPGCGQRVASEFAQKNQNIPEDKKPRVIAYRHMDDIVYLAGGAHLALTETIHVKESKSSSVLKAHSLSHSISEYNVRNVKTRKHPVKITHTLVESLRITVRKIIKWHIKKGIKQEKQLDARIQLISRYLGKDSKAQHIDKSPPIFNQINSTKIAELMEKYKDLSEDVKLSVLESVLVDLEAYLTGAKLITREQLLALEKIFSQPSPLQK